VFDQFDMDLPVYIVQSTFGGAPEGSATSAPTAAAQQHRRLVHRPQQPLQPQPGDRERGANPAREGTPGGGSGGAIYNDGNTFT
jgi:hypothetical protein